MKAVEKMNINELEKQWMIIEEEIERAGKNRSELIPSSAIIRELKNKQREILNAYRKKLTAWDRVYLSRHPKRPKAGDFIEYLFDKVFYLHGDRYFGDDGTIVGALGFFEGRPVTILGTNKGKCLEENMECNFGMSNPEGYRKALRLMKQAEKFGRPVITIIDTPGAYPGIGAEERGQGEAIAKNLFFMSDLKVPVIALITGEGGSGGALALSVADSIVMLENATFSVLSPEGFASILWKDAKLAKKAADKMKMTAGDLYERGLVDGVVPEEIAFSKEGFKDTMVRTKNLLKELLDKMSGIHVSELTKRRYDKYRKIGAIEEGRQYGL